MGAPSPQRDPERDAAEHRGGVKPRLSERLEVHVLPEHVEGLERLADLQGSTRAEQVRNAIRRYLSESSS